MRFLIKALVLGMTTFLYGVTIFAYTCPPVTGCSLTWHKADHTQCLYSSNHVVGNSPNPTLCLRTFLLTDSRYYVKYCKINPANNKCECYVSAK